MEGSVSGKQELRKIWNGTTTMGKFTVWPFMVAFITLIVIMSFFFTTVDKVISILDKLLFKK